MGKYICFCLGGQEYAVRISCVDEIIEAPHITSVFLSPPYISGLINLRGIIITVIDLKILFQFENYSDNHTNSHVIVCHAKNRDSEFIQTGFLIDDFTGMRVLDESKLEPPPESLSDQFGDMVLNVLDRQEGPLIILGVDEIISSDEISDLSPAV